MALFLPETPRTNWAQAQARKFLLEQKINSLPIDVCALIKNSKICTLKKYSVQAKKLNLSFEYLIENFGQDGVTFYAPKKKKPYLILYNDRQKVTHRIRWTLAHELGHVILKHNSDFDETRLSRNGLTEESYKILDAEADAFAAELLAPTIVIIAAGWTASSDLQRHCLLSNLAAKNRSNNILTIKKVKELYFSYEQELLRAFYDHIFLNFCPECKTYFVSKEAKYCPICGSRSLMWKQGDVNIMKYSGIEVDKNCKAIICPKCDNEEILPDGNYCMICGEEIINYCEGFIDEYGHPCEEACGKHLPGNARYCPYCGAASHFLNRNFLDRWDANKTVPFDEEIPF